MMDNPDKQKTVENFLAAHPKLQALSESQCRVEEDAAIDLPDSGRATTLSLTLAEIEPWLPILEERINQNPEMLETLSKPELANETTGEKLAALIYEMSIEMAGEIFTTKRLDQLAAQVDAYRASLSPDDENDALPGIRGALLAATSKGNPSENPFLISLCWQSIQSIIKTLRVEDKLNA